MFYNLADVNWNQRPSWRSGISDKESGNSFGTDFADGRNQRQGDLKACALQLLLDKLENDLATLDTKRLIYRSPPTDVAIVSDSALLDLVLRNLVLNTIRYTHRGGLLIGCRHRGARLSIEVYNTGIGIHGDQREAVFCEFHQFDNLERDRNNGLGLGLAIARCRR